MTKGRLQYRTQDTGCLDPNHYFLVWILGCELHNYNYTIHNYSSLIRTFLVSIDNINVFQYKYRNQSPIKFPSKNIGLNLYKLTNFEFQTMGSATGNLFHWQY